MSQKVVGIAAGEAHTLALTGDGSVFSWGRGTFGRLGTGKEEDELLPVRVDFPDDASSSNKGGWPKFVGIAAGAYHSLALEEDGSVWSWGYNAYGQLGHGEENSSTPCLVNLFQDLDSAESSAKESKPEYDGSPVKISSVKAGGMMSLAIDSLGGLWIWGSCPRPSKMDEGGFCLTSCPAPVPLRYFHGHAVAKVACGNEHVVTAVCAGEKLLDGELVCYSWGNNSHGQLGLGHKESRTCPEVIPNFDCESPWAVYEIACGAFHTAVLTHKKANDQTVDCKCWTFGLGENGQLGHGTTNSICMPEPVNGLPQDAVLISLDCGLFHTSIVSAAGNVWSWGMERGLGLCPDASFAVSDGGDALFPMEIRSPELMFSGPVQIACGAAHTILVANNGYKLWAWGRGQSGVLGRGETSDSYVPCTVMWPPPLNEDLKEKDADLSDNKEAKASNREVGKQGEIEQQLSAAMEEVHNLQKKLTLMERYASVLHISIFRKPLDERHLPQSLQDSAVFDLRRELENMMESVDSDELARMEMFYRSMLAGVKDKLMKRRIQEIVKESLLSLSTRRQPY